ncbi:MAG TPA: cytochrome c biogenesis protein ResB [Candidatus Aminicenantes bacterium]|nr:cytochrome c biogenesis protein ResB [Candidatus Aminicenantes bacterium]
MKLFSSVRLAIVLIILVTLASVLGTLIPQGRSAAEYAARYGSLSGLFQALQLTRLYRSGWFLGLLLLFALNIAVCSATRLGAKWRRAFGPAEAADAQGLMASRVKARFRAAPPLATAGDRVAGLLRARRYRVTRTASAGKLELLARKRRLGWLGSDVVHLGLLVILAGGLASGLAGRRSDLALREGETAEVPRAGFSLRLDKFDTEYYPQGGVKDWKSTVTVIENGVPVLTRVVEVNHPLAHRGFLFYQSRYGRDWSAPRLELEVRKRADASFARAVTLRPGERAEVGDPDVSRVVVRAFVPDFVIGEGGRVQSRSQEPRNPAALVEAWKGEERAFSGWVFAGYPDFAQAHGGQGQSPLAFVLKRYEAGQYSVLEAAHDPGANFIWLGSALVTAGLFLAFYWPSREVRVVLEEAQGRVEVIAAGRAAKGREAFEAEFARIFDDARRLS